MTQPPAPKLQVINSPEYREDYANSVQVRVGVMDFLLTFGRATQTVPDEITLHHFIGIYLSPQQAKALRDALDQNVRHYENAFGEIRLQPEAPGGIVQ